MDAIDRQLLAFVQEDAESPSEVLAERVGLSPSAVQRRLARLRKEGAIERVVALVNPKAVGRALTILVQIEIHHEQRQALQGFERWIGRASEVQSCWYATGEADYVLLVAVRDLDHYNVFIERLMAEQNVVRKFKTVVALKTVKRGLAVQTD